MNTKLFFIQILCATCMCLFFSCSDKRALEDYEKIKRIGDEDPSYALAMLDSLEIEIREQSDYVRHKYDLLRIRLNDKAFNTAKFFLCLAVTVVDKTTLAAHLRGIFGLYKRYEQPVMRCDMDELVLQGRESSP